VAQTKENLEGNIARAFNAFLAELAGKGKNVDGKGFHYDVECATVSQPSIVGSKSPSCCFTMANIEEIMKGATEDPKRRKASDNTWNKSATEENVEQIVNAKGMFPGKHKLRDFTKEGKKRGKKDVSKEGF
jgi:hypothetical protein